MPTSAWAWVARAAGFPCPRGRGHAPIAPSRPMTDRGPPADEPRPQVSRLLPLALVLVLLMPGQAHAYIGPGAGFALAGSFFAVFAAIGSALLTFITWPVAAAVADALRLAGPAQGPVQAGGHPRPRRDGPRPDRDDARGGQAPAPRRAARPGLLQAAGHDGAAALAGRLVHVPDRGQPRQAQHLRLPHARPADLPREAQLGRDPPAPPVDPPGQVPHPAGQGRAAAAPQEPAVLEHPGRVRHLQLRPAGADHLARPRSSAACCSRRCASPTCAAPRGCSRITRPAAATRARRSAARSTTSSAPATSIRAELVGPQRPAPRRAGRPATAVHRARSTDPTAPVLEIDGARYELREGRLHRLGPGPLPRRPRRVGRRRLQVPAAGHRARVRPVRHADQHRPRASGDAGRLPVGVFDLPGQEAGHVRHARPGRGHLGAQRGRHQRRPFHPAVPRHGRRARGDVPRRARQGAARAGRLRLRRHRPAPAHVLARHRREAPGPSRCRAASPAAT